MTTLAQPMDVRRSLAAARDAVDERVDRGAEGRVAVKRLKGGNQRQRHRVGEGVEGSELRFVLVADRAQQPFGLREGIAQDEGIKGEPKSGGLGIRQPGAPQGPVDHFARGMVGRPGRVEAEVQVKEALIPAFKALDRDAAFDASVDAFIEGVSCRCKASLSRQRSRT